MPRLLVVAVCYIVGLTAVLTFGVPALRDGGASRGDGSLLFAFVSLSAMAARIGWGRLADFGGGRRRVATLRDVGMFACGAALLTWLVWPHGTAARIVALVVLSLGALGFNGVLYVIAGEIAGAARAGQAVALMSTALFGGGALAAVPLGALADVARLPQPLARRGSRVGPGRARDPAPTGLGAARAAAGSSRSRTYAAPVAAPFRVGEELELTVDSLAAGGRGVARHDGVVVFVDRALPGDRVMARIQRVKRRHGEAIAFERLSGGPDRVEAPCPHFGTCGGCRWQDLRYERQLEHKQQQVLDALQRIAGLPEPPIEPIVPAVREYAYRNKLEYAWTSTPEGVSLGFHKAGRWEEIVPIQVCLLTGDARQRRARGVPRLGTRRGPRGLRPARQHRLSSGTSSCARACARASCSASSSPPRGELPGVENLAGAARGARPGRRRRAARRQRRRGRGGQRHPDEAAVRPLLVRGGDQRPAPARLGRLLPADEHRDGRRALPATRSSRPR